MTEEKEIKELTKETVSTEEVKAEATPDDVVKETPAETEKVEENLAEEPGHVEAAEMFEAMCDDDEFEDDFEDCNEDCDEHCCRCEEPPCRPRKCGKGKKILCGVTAAAAVGAAAVGICKLIKDKK